MLQKLPKTVGDSLTLGTLVAVGICPSNDKKRFTRFASFNSDGFLVSYEVNEELFNNLLTLLGDTDDHCLGEMNNLRYTVHHDRVELQYDDGSVIFTDYK